MKKMQNILCMYYFFLIPLANWISKNFDIQYTLTGIYYIHTRKDHKEKQVFHTSWVPSLLPFHMIFHTKNAYLEFIESVSFHTSSSVILHTSHSSKSLPFRNSVFTFMDVGKEALWIQYS